ncbi:MAG TPA: ABC transporter substrate-binding protein [Sporichthyaceae bacterium]|nr:ABC transporter substrate-binding protein [Sporichthyaceae bacterium]
MRTIQNRWLATVPVIASTALVLAACGGGSNNSSVAQQPAAPAAAAPAAADAPAAPAAAAAAPAAAAPAAADAAAVAAPAAAAAAKGTTTVDKTAKAKSTTKAAKASTTKSAVGSGSAGVTSIDNAAQAAENEKIAASKGGATDIGVTKDSIKMGTISMHGMALGNVLITPLVNGIRGTFESINDRGGILGRRMTLIDCDDGPGEVSRTKACIKKLAGVDKVFALLNISSWGSASSHDDLKQFQLPSFGEWAYSQTEWQDPYMFPTHMSMIHEAMSGANWAKNVIQPKTYAMICLTSPEMQLACNQVQKIMDSGGAKLVKRADVSISETSMSAYVLSMRAANPEHIIHYVINPATMAKFMVEAAQQGYYPPKGISGNHLAAEVLGSIFGKWPTGRYWTNTTYKLWGPEFMSTMSKYARGNRGTNHHIVQSTYVGALIFEKTAKAIGPNLTRERLMAQWDNGEVYTSDASLDQRFAYTATERGNDNWNHNYGQGREFMYKYDSTNTVANPDGSPSGFTPDPNQFVIYTWK